MYENIARLCAKRNINVATMCKEIGLRRVARPVELGYFAKRPDESHERESVYDLLYRERVSWHCAFPRRIHRPRAGANRGRFDSDRLIVNQPAA